MIPPPTLQNIHLRLVRELIEVARSGTALMLQIPKGTDLVVTAQGRIATLDRAYRHHAVGGAAPLGHQLHPLWPWRQDALARLRSRRAVQ